MNISVALCTYNGEKYLEEQIISIVNQSLLPDEIVVCDDGSTDSTLEILKQLQNKVSVPIFVYQNIGNLGVVKNFEKAISLCKGDIVLLSDQDDIWMFDKVSEIVSFFDNNRTANVFFSNGELINENGVSFTPKNLFDVVNFTPQSQYYFNNGFAFELLNIANRVTGATMAVRKDYVKKIMPFYNNAYMFHDEVIAVHAINDDCIGYSNNCLIKYRIHEHQETGLKEWINCSPDNNVFESANIKCQYLSFLSLNKKLQERFTFINNRLRWKRKFYGLFVIIYKIRCYYRLYSGNTAKVLFSDFRDNVGINYRRLKRIFT